MEQLYDPTSENTNKRKNCDVSFGKFDLKQELFQKIGECVHKGFITPKNK
jgi:hypothetical protein